MCVLFGVRHTQRVRHLLPFINQYRPQLAWSFLELLLALGGATIGVGQLATGNRLVSGLATGPTAVVVTVTLAAIGFAVPPARARLAERTARRAARRAHALLDAGHIEKADALVGRALARHPRHLGLLTQKCVILLRQGRAEDALAVVQRTLKVAPGWQRP